LRDSDGSKGKKGKIELTTSIITNAPLDGLHNKEFWINETYESFFKRLKKAIKSKQEFVIQGLGKVSKK